jgi:Fe-S-cluster containining protein
MQGIMAKKKPYDCSKCPGYCCSYHIIPVTEKDLKRLADHFDLSIEAAKKKFVTKGRPEDKKDGPYKIRRKADEHFGKICRFFDQEKRCCGVYHARMTICRTYPSGRCGYYEFLKIERATQDDKELVAGTWND